MKIKVFGCPSVKRELYLLAAFSKNDIEIETVPHNVSQQMLQQKIDAAKADRIVLAMGACRTVGLHSKSVPIIAPKAHNCAALLLGSAERYRKAFSENEDSPVWINGEGCRHAGIHGQRCAVLTGFLPNSADTLPEGTKQYVSDLLLLRQLLEQDFDENAAITAFKGQCIVADAQQIIALEPF